jgi:hypothetical protein
LRRSARPAASPISRSPAVKAARTGSSTPASAFVDTNILIRHLTGDPHEMAARATAYLEDPPEVLAPSATVLMVARVCRMFASRSAFLSFTPISHRSLRRM